MTVSADEFLRRFPVHVLPKGLVRIRHFGFSQTAGVAVCSYAAVLFSVHTTAQLMLRSPPSLRCPVCCGPMLVVERMTSSQLHFRSGLILPDPQRRGLDSS